jgi:glycosyltransferase involved in cell wall biosynthesis
MPDLGRGAAPSPHRDRGTAGRRAIVNFRFHAALAATLAGGFRPQDRCPRRLARNRSLPSLRPARRRQPGDGRPYFVCIGTIEPRKNHLLLLHLWRHLAETMPAESVPRLVIIGRRGWENEQVVDMLERCPTLKRYVEELGVAQMRGWPLCCAVRGRY